METHPTTPDGSRRKRAEEQRDDVHQARENTPSALGFEAGWYGAVRVPPSKIDPRSRPTWLRHYDEGDEARRTYEEIHDRKIAAHRARLAGGA